MELFKAAETLRSNAPVSCRIADFILRAWLVGGFVAILLLSLAAGASAVAALVNLISHHISIVLR